MRIFTATLSTETNTFSAIPTGWSCFEESGIERGRTGVTRDGTGGLCHLWGEMAARDGHEVFHSVAATAAPAGRTVRAVYEALRDEIVADAAAEGPFDVALLFLHGAMVADGYDDCEGDLLGRLRAVLGPQTIIGAELDLHCHLTEAMLQNANAIITFKEYPHIDAGKRGRELYRLCVDAAVGQTKPAMGLFDCRMVNMFPTTAGRMAEFVAEMKDQEGRDGVLSLSLGHGFPWGDTADSGVRMLAVVDGDQAKAAEVARRFGERFWAIRHETTGPGLTIDEAFDAAFAAPPGLAVIADKADNTGGGAPGDSTFVLRRTLERGLRDVAIGPLWDPIAVRFCHDAGVGARFALRIGGKCGPESGDPVDAEVVVRGLCDDLVQRGLGSPSHLGPAAWVEVDGVHVVLAGRRAQAFSPELFTNIGLPLAAMRVAVVKSTAHFRAGFEPIASLIVTTVGPGTLLEDYGAIPYQRRDPNYWPRVEDPFGKA
ncbi:MAG TPA: M81 family metallopeptidase [Caulobacteraceae bacterium]|nr:M81 family metallopeptidase [Caulobacteraceae bacterium]